MFKVYNGMRLAHVSAIADSHFSSGEDGCLPPCGDDSGNRHNDTASGPRQSRPRSGRLAPTGILTN